MKKICCSLIAACVFLTGFGQPVLPPVPANASLVIKYSGNNLTRQLPLTKIDAYGFMKENVFKLIGLDSLSSLENTGIDFSKDSWQYLVAGDSATGFVTLLPLKNRQQFLQTVSKSLSKELTTTQTGAFSFTHLGSNTYLGWSEQLAVLVYADQKKPADYYYPGTEDVTTDTAVADTTLSGGYTIYPPLQALDEVAVDSVALDAERTEAVRKPVTVKRTTGKRSAAKKPSTHKQAPVKKKTTAKGKKKVAGKKTGTKPKNKKPVSKKKIVIDEEISEAMPYPPDIDPPAADSEAENSYNHYLDSLDASKQAQWYREKDSILQVRQAAVADSLVNSAFSNNSPSIAGTSRYTKVTDAQADISYFVNYDQLFGSIWPLSLGQLYRYTVSPLPALPKKLTGFIMGGNVYFEKDRVRVAHNLFTEDAEMAKWTKAMYKSRQKKSIASYIRPDDIAYLSGSLNTEAASHYYYNMMRNYLGNGSTLSNTKEAADVIVDLIELVIDEKALADLIPGNFVFALHGIGTKKVTYSTYEYDDDFNQQEVKKTKDEMSPDFSMVFETRNPAFVEKLLRLPARYGKNSSEDFKYFEHNGYYEWGFDADKDLINHLYLVVKGDRLVFTTSKPMLDLTLKQEVIRHPKDLRKKIFKNNYTMKLNSGKLISQLSRELNTGSAAKIKDYLRDNLGDMEMNSFYKDGIVHSNGYMAVKGNHSNSLAFFFNLIDTIAKIYDEEKHTIEVDGIELDTDDVRKQPAAN
ncbi:MAG: DUF4836 family protein [Flavihumibacter sp.]